MSLESLGSPGLPGSPGSLPPVLLVAHGSRDPYSTRTMRALARAVAARWPASVTTAFLDFNLPAVAPALRGLATATATAAVPVAVPALLTRAYHGKVDVPAALAGAGVPVRLAPVLGPEGPGQPADGRLITALRRRVAELGVDYDALVLIAAGTRDVAAKSTVEDVAGQLGSALGVSCVAGYAAGALPGVDGAIAQLRAAGARRIVAASYFLAPGRLFDVAADAARTMGVLGVARPLGVAPELVDLVLHRVTPMTY